MTEHISSVNLKFGVEDRLKKRGKPPRIVRYFFYCGWAHALIVSIKEDFIVESLVTKRAWSSRNKIFA